MTTLEDNYAFVEHVVNSRSASSSGHPLLAIGHALGHTVGSRANYARLRDDIVEVAPASLADILRLVAITGYESPVTNSEVVSDEDHAGIIVSDGLLSLLALLNESLISLHESLSPDTGNVRSEDVAQASKNAWLALQGIAQPCPRVPSESILKRHKVDLVRSLMYWASDQEVVELLPEVAAHPTPSTQAFVTQYQQLLVVCHELGHVLHDWVKSHDQAGATLSAVLKAAATRIEEDETASLLVRDATAWAERMADESTSDYIAHLLYSAVVTSKGRSTGSLAEIAPFIFYYYSEIAESLRMLRRAYRQQNLDTLLTSWMPWSISRATHPPGNIRRQEYLEASHEWHASYDRVEIASFDDILCRLHGVAVSGPYGDSEISEELAPYWSLFLGKQ